MMPLPPMKSSSDFIVEALEQPIRILYEDAYLVAVDKPAGLMVHRGANTLPLEPVLLQVLRDQLQRFLYPIHRLDRPTSGLVLFAFDSRTASKLGELMMERRIEKYYQALVRGFMPEELTETRPLADREPVKRKIDPEHRNTVGSSDQAELQSDTHPTETVQSASTHFRCLQRFEVPWPLGEFATSRFSLLEVHPITGRWHQIRRHLNFLAHPVVGDHRHGDHRWNQMFFERTGHYRMMLTAMRMDFRHPVTQEWLTLQAPRGESFDEAVRALSS
jgi:tRNA pseudouridine65 synthase